MILSPLSIISAERPGPSYELWNGLERAMKWIEELGKDAFSMNERLNLESLITD